MISLQFITHQTERYSYLESARMALEGGCKWIQLRMKDALLEEVEAVALQLKPLCKEHEAILILDDHVELAKKLEVDGVHLGKKDMPIDQARQILGEAFIIGGTANTFEDVVQHYRAGADYLGIGPFRFTTTKKNLSPVLGLEGYSSILSQLKNIKGLLLLWFRLSPPNQRIKRQFGLNGWMVSLLNLTNLQL